MEGYQLVIVGKFISDEINSDSLGISGSCGHFVKHPETGSKNLGSNFCWVLDF